MQFGIQRGLTPAIKGLLIANGGVYLLQMLTSSSAIIQNFGLVPSAILNHFYIWQVFTYMFVHGGFFHILFNMFALWMFGTDLERQWGTREFLKFYLVTGIGAGIITFLLTIYSSIPTIGASGAVFGVLVAFAVLYPNRMVYIYFLFPVKVKYLVMVLIAIGILAAWRNDGDGISHFTHLGGALIGYLYLKSDWWRLGAIFRPFQKMRFKRKTRVKIKHNRKQAQLMDEVDRVLDRITELGGYDNLSEKDKKVLDDASKKLSNKKD